MVWVCGEVEEVGHGLNSDLNGVISVLESGFWKLLHSDNTSPLTDLHTLGEAEVVNLVFLLKRFLFFNFTSALLLFINSSETMILVSRQSSVIFLHN